MELLEASFGFRKSVGREALFPEHHSWEHKQCGLLWLLSWVSVEGKSVTACVFHLFPAPWTFEVSVLSQFGNPGVRHNHSDAAQCQDGATSQH